MLEPFFTRLDKIDEIISRGPKDCDFSQDIKPLLKESASTKYFYDSLKDPEWLEILVHAGEFYEIPEPYQESDNVIVYPLWPQSHYLARMAELIPDKVLELILQMPDTKNFQVNGDFIDATLAMPPELASKLVPRAIIWLKQPFQLQNPEKLGELVAHLARGNQVDEALDLARSLLALAPDSQDESREPKARFDTWAYERIINKYIPNLIDTAEERGLMLLCDLLEDSIRLSQYDKRDISPDDSSFLWRRAVEDHNQNFNHRSRDLLVSAVRDAAETLIKAKGKEILELVERRPFKIFKRIGLYLRQLYPDVDPEGTAQLIADPDVFDDIHLHHELFHLLNNQFGTFPQEIQHSYLDLVAQGTDIEEWLDFREQKTRTRPSLKEGKQHDRYWKYTKLWPIQEFLDKEWRQQFDKFKNEFKELEHPDFHVYITTSYGYTSPKKDENLCSMKIEDLIKFLKTWQSTDDFMGPSREGLGRELTSLVTSESEHFATEAKQFRGLDPIYIRALFSGIRPKKQENTFPWAPVLDLCCWVMEQPREIPGYKSDFGDPGWISTRMAITDMLSFAFGPDSAEVSFDLRPVLWKVLKSLTDDPDPTPDNEASIEEIDPVTLSLNTVRGKAMHAVIKYALWIKRHFKEMPDGEERILQGFDEMPEVREVLDSHLNHSYDPSLAIRAVYGQWFPWLNLLDYYWAASNATRIFPHEKALHIFREAAWFGYINFSVPYSTPFRLLQREYIHAIELIGTTSKMKSQYTEPDKRLAEHLMTLYWQGEIDINKPKNLLKLFYEKASDELCGHAFKFIGHSLINTEERVPPKVLDRIKSLWNNRIDVARTSEASILHVNEISAFGWWFASAKFDDKWAVAQLKEVLELTDQITPDHLVVERLAVLVTNMPTLTIKCLGLIIKNDKKGWSIRRWREHARTILSTILQSNDKIACQLAKDLINYLGSQGNLDFRDLLQ